MLIEIGTAIEIENGAIGDDFDDDPDTEFDFDLEPVGHVALHKFDASAKIIHPQAGWG